MSRDRNLERQLVDWLESGPVTAPPEVVDSAIERTASRRQRRHAWRRLGWPTDLLGRSGEARRLVRLAVLSAILAGMLLAGLLVSLPFAGGPGPAPQMDASRPAVVTGVARATSESTTPAGVVRVIDVDVGDPRIDGGARQELAVLLDTGTGMYRWRGTMRLENAWGAWAGPVDIAAYPTGERFELASLTGSGAYEGFTYLHTIVSQSSEAERTVEGAIWPGEPPPMPDPSLLP